MTPINYNNITMEQAKEAFEYLTSCCEENEKEYLEEHLEDCVEDITEEDFQEKYDGDAYKLPLENIMGTFGDLRLVRAFFKQQEEKQKQNVPVDLTSISDKEKKTKKNKNLKIVTEFKKILCKTIYVDEEYIKFVENPCVSTKLSDDYEKCELCDGYYHTDDNLEVEYMDATEPKCINCECLGEIIINKCTGECEECM